MDSLLKILSNVLEEEKSKEEKDKFKNLTDLYNLCVSKGYVGDMAKFKSEYTKLVEQCSNMLKTSEISDLDLESVAGGVNINVSLKSSIAMIMGALSLSGSTSSIANAANTKFESNNSSISNKIATWGRSESKLKKNGVLAVGIGSAMLGALGATALSLPIGIGITTYKANLDDLNNVVRLVYSLNAEDSESVSFNRLTDTQKEKLIKSAYSELGIKLNKTIDISRESVHTTLLSKLNEKIAKLNKHSESDKVKLEFSRLSILKVCLETKSNAGIISQSNGQQQLAPGNASPSPNMAGGPGTPPPPPPPPLPGGPGMPPPPTPGGPGMQPPIPGETDMPKKELSDADRAEIEGFEKRLQDYEKKVNTHLETAQKNRDQFKNGDATDARAAELLAIFMENRKEFNNIVAHARNSAKTGDMEGLRKACNEAKKVMDSLPRSAAAILEGARRAEMTSDLNKGIAKMRNKIENKANN